VTQMSTQQHREEADHWFARLSGANCTHQDREAFERWRAEPARAAAYAKTERLWNSLEQFSGHAQVEALSSQILARAVARRHWSAPRIGLALAASVTVAVLVALGYSVVRGYVLTDTYSTVAGERSTFRLEDGSQVVLNSATRLKVKFTDSQRHLKLMRGEAVFVVADDRARPFRVEAQDGEVTALGTRFQVRNESRRVIVTLLEGRIALDRESMGQHWRLRPGEQVKFTLDDSEVTQRTVDPEVVSSWTTGRLRFRATPLGEALEEVNRYTGAQIRLADVTLASTPVNGNFELGDVASLVSALTEVLPIEVASQTEHEVVLKKR
jgi:transmembrane sensor